MVPDGRTGQALPWFVPVRRDHCAGHTSHGLGNSSAVMHESPTPRRAISAATAAAVGAETECTRWI